MEKEQEEMQFLGVLGIYSESYKIIWSCRKIFSQITLSLILPLSFVFLARIQVSDLLFSKIRHDQFLKLITPPGTKRHDKLSDLVSSDWALFWLFKFLYFTLLLALSLLSTAAVVYTVASVYTAREVTFRTVIAVVPKVWKRLMLTFLCSYSALLVYNAVALLILILWAVTLAFTVAGTVVFFSILILYSVGFVYMTVVWQLASVVSVLEEFYGFRAMVKSKELIKGKTWVAVAIFFKLNFSLVAIYILFRILVVQADSVGVLGRIGFGILSFMLLCKLFLFGLVIQTVIYLVCKSHHHENIDKSALSDHLEVYLGEYVPLKAKDVQLEQFHV